MTRPWDEGITWRQLGWRDIPGAEAPAAVLDLDYVVDKVLNVMNDGYDADYVTRLIASATESAEHETHRALAPQLSALVMSGFPAWSIPLPSPPFIEVRSFTYYDSGGTQQSLSLSPEPYVVVPSGRYSKARLTPLPGASWPATQCREDAVRIEFMAGYDPVSTVLEDIKTGICLMIAELYKQRDLSVAGANTMVPSVLQLERFWKPVY